MVLKDTQLQPAASEVSISHSNPNTGMVSLSSSVILVMTSGVTFSMMIDATTSEHLISGSYELHLNTKCSCASLNSSIIEF